MCFIEVYKLLDRLNEQRNEKMDGKQNKLYCAKQTKNGFEIICNRKINVQHIQVRRRNGKYAQKTEKNYGEIVNRYYWDDMAIY